MPIPQPAGTNKHRSTSPHATQHASGTPTGPGLFENAALLITLPPRNTVLERRLQRQYRKHLHAHPRHRATDGFGKFCRSRGYRHASARPELAGVAAIAGLDAAVDRPDQTRNPMKALGKTSPNDG